MIAPMLKIARRMFPSLARAIADGGYQGAVTAEAVRVEAKMPLEIVKRSDAARASRCCPSAGLSSAHSDGSVAAADWRKTSRTSRARTLPSLSWP